MENYRKLDLLKVYRNIFREYLVKSIQMFHYSIRIKNKFGKNLEMQKILQEEIASSIAGLGVELEVLNFIFRNNKSINLENINNYFDAIDKNFEKEFHYFEQFFDNLQVAYDTELAYKFYKPKGGFAFHKKEDTEKFISYLKGFSLDQIKVMLYFEGVYNIEESENSLVVLERINNMLKNIDIKELDVAIESNLDLFGIFEKNGDTKLLIPKVKSEEGTYIATHELVRLALLEKRDIIKDDSITFGEDLPIFYEYLFKNNYLKDFAENGPFHGLTEISKVLLETYNDESFDEQIEKVKRIK